MKEDGVIENYAVGGAVAAMFYIEAFATEDLDIFFALSDAGRALDLLAPIHDYLKRRGYQPEGATVDIEGWPVQFLPLYKPLIEEAVERAVETEYGQTFVRVVSSEHLVAIMLDTGRPKDYARIARFLELSVVDVERLARILARHGLGQKWRENLPRFIS